MPTIEATVPNGGDVNLVRYTYGRSEAEGFKALASPHNTLTGGYKCTIAVTDCYKHECKVKWYRVVAKATADGKPYKEYIRVWPFSAWIHLLDGDRLEFECEFKDGRRLRSQWVMVSNLTSPKSKPRNPKRRASTKPMDDVM